MLWNALLKNKYDVPVGMPVYQHTESCPTFLQYEQGARDDAPQFDDNSGYFYYVELRREAAINVNRYSEFGILNGDLGTTENDIYVLRLMPFWRKIENPFRYDVVLVGVDAKGNLYEDRVSQKWDDVTVDFEQVDGSGMTVKALKDSGAFRDWIAQNPTYDLWESVNIASGIGEDGINSLRAAFQSSLEVYLEDKEDFEEMTEAEFQAEMKKIADHMLEREFGKDYGSMALEDLAVGHYGDYTYVVNKANGTIANIRKNDGSSWPDPTVTYFTLKAGDGLTVTAPEGMYTLTELGSKSGGSYLVDVAYLDEEHAPKTIDQSWEVPNTSEKTYWVKGTKMEPITPDGNPGYGPGARSVGSVYQVKTKARLEIGAAKTVKTFYFTNQTSTVAFEELVMGAREQDDSFGFEAALNLEGGTTPLYDEEHDYHYFNFVLYNVVYGRDDVVEIEKPEDAGPDWQPKGTLAALS